MKVGQIVITSAAALALASCGHKATTDNTSTTTTTNVADASTNMTETAPADGQSFANAAAASDAFEIATSKLALSNSQSSAIKKFANQMVTAHTGSTAKLKTAAGSASPALTPDPALTADQQQQVDAMKAMTGADFDQAYAKAQVDGHQKTLDALKAYAATGTVASLKTFASTMVPTVAAHLNMAKGLNGR